MRARGSRNTCATNESGGGGEGLEHGGWWGWGGDSINNCINHCIIPPSGSRVITSFAIISFVLFVLPFFSFNSIFSFAVINSSSIVWRLSSHLSGFNHGGSRVFTGINIVEKKWAWDRDSFFSSAQVSTWAEEARADTFSVSPHVNGAANALSREAVVCGGSGLVMSLSTSSSPMNEGMLVIKMSLGCGRIFFRI